MEVKELRDLIKVIHDSGDCGQTLSDVLEMANKICEHPSDLEIVQKALEKTECRLSIHVNGSWDVDDYMGGVLASGIDQKALLTWAKQTIGE